MRILLAALLALVALPQNAPPVEPGSFRTPDLVELITLDPTIKLDIRYATPNNLAGRPVYAEARAFLQRPAAEALLRANRALHDKGYGVLVFDGYRPWSVTKLFWDVTAPEKREFVADPAKGSKHNRGCAVDLTLHDLATGAEVAMPSPYDDFTERAHRDLLRAAMEAEGFTVYENEWWHFDYRDWRRYPILDLPLDGSSALSAGAEGHDGSWHGFVEEIPDAVSGRVLKPQDPGKPTDNRILLVKIRLDGPTPRKLGQRVEVAIEG